MAKAESAPMEAGNMATEEQKARLKRIKDSLKVTKVVCTRSVKGKNGDAYVGWSAGWDTVQEDGGHGLVHTGTSEESPEVPGMSVSDAKLATLVLGMQVDLAAHDNAMAGGSINGDQRQMARKAITHNYTKLLAEALKNGSSSSEDD